MRVTTKGQVTIPRHIREKLEIFPNSEIDFKEKGGRVYLIKTTHKTNSTPGRNKFQRFRGIATIKMSTEEIMALTRGTK